MKFCICCKDKNGDPIKLRKFSYRELPDHRYGQDKVLGTWHTKKLKSWGCPECRRDKQQLLQLQLTIQKRILTDLYEQAAQTEAKIEETKKELYDQVHSGEK